MQMSRKPTERGGSTRRGRRLHDAGLRRVRALFCQTPAGTEHGTSTLRTRVEQTNKLLLRYAFFRHRDSLVVTLSFVTAGRRVRIIVLLRHANWFVWIINFHTNDTRSTLPTERIAHSLIYSTT